MRIFTNSWFILKFWTTQRVCKWGAVACHLFICFLLCSIECFRLKSFLFLSLLIKWSVRFSSYLLFKFPWLDFHSLRLPKRGTIFSVWFNNAHVLDSSLMSFTLYTNINLSILTGTEKKIRKPKPWKHPQPITRTQLIQLRDEFWDTAPHYGGRKGIIMIRSRTINDGFIRVNSLLVVCCITLNTSFSFLTDLNKLSIACCFASISSSMVMFCNISIITCQDVVQ